jgi:Holliday junction resolvase RusA-like endonuclease
MNEFKITLPIAPVTKKNSQRIVINQRTGRPFILPSEAYKEYELKARILLPNWGIDYPVNVEAVFYMPTKRRVDLVNLQEALLDAMVKAGTLTDDNSNIVVSMDGSRVTYDKENPRTEVKIRRVHDAKGSNQGTPD